MTDAVPVVDLFSGPGGLAEGFAALKDPLGRPRFNVVLSIEMEPTARRTLLLRGFLRKFPSGYPPAYYDFLNGVLAKEPDWASLYPREWQEACDETWCLKLGTSEASSFVRQRIAGIRALCQRRLKIQPKGGAKDCHLGWWSELGVRLGVGDALRGFFGGSGQRSHAELERSAPAGRPQGGMVYRVGVGLATRASGARCRPGPGDGVPQFSHRHCFCGRGFG